MNKTLSILLYLFSPTFVFAQFAIVSDKDGRCHVRTGPEMKNNITDTLTNGHFVYCFETTGNWINIDYSKKNRDLNGYVYHDRVKLISEFKEIPLQVQKGNSATYMKDSVEVVVTIQNFKKSQYRFSYFKDDKEVIQLINGKHYWGTDGGLPRTEYKSISITIGKRNIALPKPALENLFQPTLLNVKINYDQQNDILYIQSFNSDGAGGYYVIWKIENGRYKSRYVAHGF